MTDGKRLGAGMGGFNLTPIGAGGAGAGREVRLDFDNCRGTSLRTPFAAAVGISPSPRLTPKSFDAKGFTAEKRLRSFGTKFERATSKADVAALTGPKITDHLTDVY